MNKILYHYIKLMYHSYRFSTFVFFATNPNFDFCCSQVQFPQNHRSCLRHVFWVRFRFSSSQRWFNFKKWNLLTTCWFRKIIFIDRPRQVQGSKPTRLSTWVRLTENLFTFSQFLSFTEKIPRMFLLGRFENKAFPLTFCFLLQTQTPS